MTPGQIIVTLQRKAAHEAALAQRYREALLHAAQVGTPRAYGTYRGAGGNARDPEHGWHYSPRIRRAAIMHATASQMLYATVRLLMGAETA